MEESEIKALTPVECPHCHKTIVVEFTTAAPKLSEVYTPEMIDAAKKDAVDQIIKLEAPEEKTKPVIEWINNTDTIFGPSDVQEIIKNIQNQNHEPGEET